MHAFILGVALALAGIEALAATDAPPARSAMACPRATATVVERFISADCAPCWTDAAAAAVPHDQWLLDWIVPSARGDDAPLAPAAPSESAQRARRALGTGLTAERTSVHRSAARTASGAASSLRVVSGPAFNGYFGVQLDGRGVFASGTGAWIALVEVVAAGTDGTAVPRQLVRTVAGPFEPTELRSGKPWRVLQAMRWPETAKPERLLARAWLENAEGRIVAMAGERCTPR